MDIALCQLRRNSEEQQIPHKIGDESLPEENDSEEVIGHQRQRVESLLSQKGKFSLNTGKRENASFNQDGSQGQLECFYINNKLYTQTSHTRNSKGMAFNFFATDPSDIRTRLQSMKHPRTDTSFSGLDSLLIAGGGQCGGETLRICEGYQVNTSKWN